MRGPPDDRGWFATSPWALRLVEDKSWLGVLLWAMMSKPYGLKVAADGITALYSGGKAEHYPWAAVGELTFRPGKCLVPLERKTVTVGGPQSRVDAFAAEIERLRPPPDPAPPPGLAPPTVAPDQIADWLGIGLDDHLTLLLPRWRGWGQLSVVAWMLPAMVLVHLPDGDLVNVQQYALFWAGYMAFKLWCGWERRPELLVTPYGLRQHRLNVPWEQVKDITNSRRGWRIETTQRDFVLPHGEPTDRVASAIQRLLAERRAGAILPRMTDVPDHALSRAESVDVSAERGISPAEGDGRDET